MRRDDFPVLGAELPGGRPLAYLDNAASSQKPRAVIDRLRRYYEAEHANVHRGLHHLADLATTAFESARRTMADFLGGLPHDGVVFTRGTTDAINLVAQSWARAGAGPGDVVLLSRMEHHSNIVPWQLAGATLRWIDLTEDGRLADDWESLLDERVKLVAITHVSNALGTVNPVREIADRAHAVGARVLVDAAQSVPHMPIDFDALGADWLVCSGHKMCGPTGIGVLAARPELLDEMPPAQGGGEMIDQVFDDHSTWADPPHKFEAGTPNIAGAVGLGAAAEYLRDIGMEAIEAETRRLGTLARERLAAQDDVTLYGPGVGGPVVSFNLDGIHSHDLAQIVDQEGVAIRAGHLCCQPLMRALGVSSVARASFSFANNEEDIDRLLAALDTARRLLRR